MKNKNNIDEIWCLFNQAMDKMNKLFKEFPEGFENHTYIDNRNGNIEIVGPVKTLKINGYTVIVPDKVRKAR